MKKTLFTFLIFPLLLSAYLQDSLISLEPIHQQIADEITLLFNAIASPPFEKNGHHIEMEIEDFAFVDNSLSHLALTTTVQGRYFSIVSFLEHYHPDFPLADIAPYHTAFKFSLSPFTLHAKIGKHLIDKELLKKIITAIICENDIATHQFVVDIPEWNVLSDGTIKKGRVDLSLFLQDIHYSIWGYLQLAKVSLVIENSTLQVEIKLQLDKNEYKNIIEPKIDRIIAYVLLLQNLDPETIDWVQAHAAMISNFLRDLEYTLEK